MLLVNSFVLYLQFTSLIEGAISESLLCAAHVVVVDWWSQGEREPRER